MFFPLKASEDNNLNLTEDEIREEIAADLSEKFLQNEENIKSFIKEKPSLAKKVVEVIKSLARKFKNMLTKGDKSYEYNDTKLLGEYFNEAEKKWLNALASVENGENAEGKAKYSIKTDENGKKVVVLDKNIFEGVERKDRPKHLLQYMKENYAGKELVTYDNKGNAETVNVPTLDMKLPSGAKAINKLAYTGRSDKNNTIRQGAVSQIDEVLETSQYDHYTEDKNNKHEEFAEKGWEYRRATLNMETEDGYKVYEVNINVAKASNGKKYVYDINGVKYTKTIYKKK